VNKQVKIVKCVPTGHILLNKFIT